MTTLETGFAFNQYAPPQAYEEKDSKDGEGESFFVPLAMARSRITQLSAEMKLMQKTHLSMINEINKSWEQIGKERYETYERVLNKVKNKAYETLQKHKKTIGEMEKVLEDEKVDHMKASLELKAQIEELEERLQQQIQRYDSLQDELQDKKDRIVFLTSEVDRKVEPSQLDALEDKIAEIEDAKQRVEEEKSRLEEEVIEKSATLKEVEEEIESLRPQIDDLQSLQQERDNLRDELDHMKTDMEELERQLDEEKRLRAEDHDKREAEDMDRQDQESQASAAQVADLKKQLRIANLEIAEFRKQDNEGGLSAQESEATKKKIADLEATVLQLRQEIDKLETTNKRLKADADIYSAASAQPSGVVETGPTQAEMDEYKRQLEAYQKRMEEIEEAQKQNAVASAANASSDANSAEIARLRAEQEELKPKIIESQNKLRSKLAQFKKMKAEYKAKETQRDVLMAKHELDRLKDANGNPKKLTVGDVNEIDTLLGLYRSNVALRNEIMAAQQRHPEIKSRISKLMTDEKAETKKLLAMKEEGTSPEDIAAQQKKIDQLKASQAKVTQELHDNHAKFTEAKKTFQEKEEVRKGILTKFNLNRKVAGPDGKEVPVKVNKKELADLVEVFRDMLARQAEIRPLHAEMKQENPKLAALQQRNKEIEAKIAELEAAGGGGATTGQVTVPDALPKPVKPEGNVSSSAAAASGGGAANTAIIQRLKTELTKQRDSYDELQAEIHKKEGELANKERQLAELKSSSARELATAVRKARIEGAQSAPTPTPAPAGPTGMTAEEKKKVQENMRKLADQITKLTAERDELKSKHAEEISARETKISQLEAEIKTLESGDVDERVALVKQQAETAEKALHDKENELSSTESKLKASLDQVTQLEEKLAQAETRAQEAEKKAAQAPLASSQLSSEPPQAASTGGGGIGSTSDEEVQKIRQELASANDKVRELEGKVANKIKEIESMRAAAGSQEVPEMTNADIRSMKTDMEKLSEEHIQTKNLLGAEQKKSGQLTEQLEKSKAETEAAKADKTEALTKQKADYTEKFKQVIGKLKTSEASLQQTEAARKELEEKLEAETKLREERDATIASLSSEKEELTKQMAEVQAKMDQVQGEMDSKNQTIEQLETKVKELEELKVDMEAKAAKFEEVLREEQKARKKFQFELEGIKGKIRVYARVRPFTKAEKKAKERKAIREGKNAWTLQLNTPKTTMMGDVEDDWRDFECDNVFLHGRNGSQEDVFEETQGFAEMAAEGINTCVFAYGQSGTGKTYTTMGTPEAPGLKPRMIRRIYQIANDKKSTHDYKISCHMVEIYLNKLEDLIWKQQTAVKYKGKKKSKWPSPPELKVRINKKKVMIENVTKMEFATAAEMIEFSDLAEVYRRTRKTGLNEASSRSHLIFTMYILATDKKTGRKNMGKLSLCDLAGSERADKTNVEGLSKTERAAMMEEGVAINTSLKFLKDVFRVLGSMNNERKKGERKAIVQYRGNMLTELMQDSLGGKARTLMFVNVGPAESNVPESIDSLQYANFVNNIQNEVASADADYTEEIQRLKNTVDLYIEKYGEL